MATTGPADDVRAVARTPLADRRMVPLALLNGVNVSFWVWRLTTQETGRARVVVLAVAGVLVLGLVATLIWAVRRRGGAVLVLTGTQLRIDRRVKPVVIARDDVLAVRGDVPGRPSWSEHVLVQTPDGTVTLPPLDQAPKVLVPLLQEWAEVGEQVAT